MTDKKISQLPAGTTPDGTEEAAWTQGGQTVRLAAQAIADLASGGGGTVTQPITSGASPVDVTLPAGDWAKLIVEVTSGGTMGVEVVNLPEPSTNGDGYNADYIGRTVVITLKTQTDPSDVVNVTINGGDTIAAHDNMGLTIGEASGNVVVLDVESEDGTFMWAGFNWFWANYDGNSSSVVTGQRFPLPTADEQFVSRHLIVDESGQTPTWEGGPYSPGTYFYVTSGASPITADGANSFCYTTRVETGGTQGTEVIQLPDVPTGGVPKNAGARHVIELEEQADPADVLSVDVSNVSDIDGNPITSITMDAAGEYALFEYWADSEWRYLRGTATVT